MLCGLLPRVACLVPVLLPLGTKTLKYWLPFQTKLSLGDKYSVNLCYLHNIDSSQKS